MPWNMKISNPSKTPIFNPFCCNSGYSCYLYKHAVLFWILLSYIFWQLVLQAQCALCEKVFPSISFHFLFSWAGLVSAESLYQPESLACREQVEWRKSFSKDSFLLSFMLINQTPQKSWYYWTCESFCESLRSLREELEAVMSVISDWVGGVVIVSLFLSDQ